MIDLLSYTTMDLHAAWPVAGCRSSSRLLGVCVASSSSNVMSGSRQLRGTHVPIVRRSRRLSGWRLYPHHGVPSTGRGLASCRPRRGEPGDGYPGSPPLDDARERASSTAPMVMGEGSKGSLRVDEARRQLLFDQEQPPSVGSERSQGGPLSARGSPPGLKTAFI